MSFFLALDAGGTKTDYVLADESRELARVRTGTIKRMRTDAATASQNLDAALAALAATSGVAMSAVARTCIGTAGITVPFVTDFLRAEFSARVSGELILVGDVEIALDAAFRGGPGVLVLAGTGSNIAARLPDGTLTTAGGWGPALADQGSGNRIGHEALRGIFLAHDEGRSTALLAAVADFWQLDAADPLIHLVEVANRIPAPDFSRLTELVLDCANAGDPVAQSVLRKEGEDLGWLVRMVVRRFLPEQSAVALDSAALPSIAFAGSIMDKVAPVREALIASVRQEFPQIQTLPGVVDPIDGALWRARTGGVS
jgi:N-acetylglucosamine kinase-like BadF-type ATPase